MLLLHTARDAHRIPDHDTGQLLMHPSNGDFFCEFIHLSALSPLLEKGHYPRLFMTTMMDPSFDMPPLHLPDDAELFEGNFAFGGCIDHFQCGNGYVWTPEVVDDCEAVVAAPQHPLDVSERSWNPSWMHNDIGFNQRQRPQVAFRGPVAEASPAVQTISAPIQAAGESAPSSAPKRRKTAPNKLAHSPDASTPKPRAGAKQLMAKIEVPTTESETLNAVRTPETAKRKKPIRDKSEKSAAIGTPSTTHNILWTEAEHALFEIGLNLYGRGQWVLIAQHVQTRNHLQVKYHARQYFRKLETGSAQPGGAVASPADSATPTTQGSSRSNSDQGSVESDDPSAGQNKAHWNAGRDSFYFFSEEQGLDANAAAVKTFSHMASKRHNEAVPLAVRN
jgi:hypothetical protein